jgi:hypothetical protein
MNMMTKSILTYNYVTSKLRVMHGWMIHFWCQNGQFCKFKCV